MVSSIALWLVAGLLGGTPQAAGGAPTLIVQLVDPGWTPVPSQTVQVTPTTSCGAKPVAAGKTVEAKTDGAGFASFQVPDKATYLIDVAKASGFLPTPKCVRIFRRANALPTAYVQLQVRSPKIVVQAK